MPVSAASAVPNSSPNALANPDLVPVAARGSITFAAPLAPKFSALFFTPAPANFVAAARNPAAAAPPKPTVPTVIPTSNGLVSCAAPSATLRCQPSGACCAQCSANGCGSNKVFGSCNASGSSGVS